MSFKPEMDGIDHINVYSKGKTYLGRYLTNFAYSPFELADHGKFDSIEGYWYWLLAEDHPHSYVLREMYGFKAKSVGKELSGKDWRDDEEFKGLIRLAINAKLYQGPKDMLNLFIKSDLPFTHYYVYGKKIINVPQGKWIMDYLECLRAVLKAERLTNGV